MIITKSILKASVVSRCMCKSKTSVQAVASLGCSRTIITTGIPIRLVTFGAMIVALFNISDNILNIDKSQVSIKYIG